MANSYTKAAFGLTVTAAEAALLAGAIEAAALLDDGDDDPAARAASFATLGADFATAFPPTDDDPFAGFLTLFDDADYPYLGCDIDIGEADAVGRVEVYFSGEQFDVGVAAELVFRVCRSALPFGFEYAFDCDKLRAGEFGGGYVLITAEHVHFNGTATLLDRALARAHGDTTIDGFVLTTRHSEHGLSFWNNDAGFGPLARATVFTEREADDYDVPIADDQPEWLALPAPRHP